MKRLPRWAYRLMSSIPKLLFRAGLGRLLSGKVLLLETIGRKTGEPHQVPLQYEQVEDKLYLGSARGEHSDWFKNAIATPSVRCNLGAGFRSAKAHPLTGQSEVLEYLELRLDRHPKMMRRILSLEGLPAEPSRQQLAEYADTLALLVLEFEAQNNH